MCRYLTLQFVAESLLPPRKPWQMVGHFRAVERRLPPSFEALVACVASLNSLKNKLGLYQPGLQPDAQRRLRDLRFGSSYGDGSQHKSSSRRARGRSTSLSLIHI